MTNELRHGVIGLPRSGKTTFLAALWHLVTADEIEAGLECRSTVGNVAYLAEIAECWRRCKPMERTRQLTAAYVTLALTDVSTGLEFDLCFPDVAGENFDNQLMTRELDSEHASWLDHPGGTLLFLSAEASPDGQRLSDLGGLLEAEEEAEPEIAEGTENEPQISAADAEAGWTPKMMTEQAKLVELLQIGRYLDEQEERRRLAIIISAWDVVADEGLSPDAWLKRERPLLWQFIKANSDDLEAQVFGVSAQGGQVEDEATRSELLEVAAPSERISCVDGHFEDHDLTRPIRWLHQPSS
ncbi:MAG: hypothetical protein V2I43_06590 [Parvularcula sp.]|jgi:hypothetical protein|nr:hypothetical protein [Parvularcula sp.]